MLLKDFLSRKTKDIVSTIRGTLNKAMLDEQEEASRCDESLSLSSELDISWVNEAVKSVHKQCRLMRQSGPVSPAGIGSCSPR